VPEEKNYPIKINWSNYYREPFQPSEHGEKAHRKANLHDALPYALSDNTLYNEDLAEFLGIQEPNRVIGEDEDTSSWLNTEDWAISCKKGHFVIGQTVSCNEKGEIEDFGIKKEKHQVRQFEHRIKPSRAYEYLDSAVLATMPHENNEVAEYEKNIREKLEYEGFATIDVHLKLFDKDGGDWSKIFSVDEIFPPYNAD